MSNIFTRKQVPSEFNIEVTTFSLIEANHMVHMNLGKEDLAVILERKDRMRVDLKPKPGNI